MLPTPGGDTQRWIKFNCLSLPRAGLNMQRNRRVPFAIWVTLWAIIVLAALALIITIVAWFAIP